MKLATYRRPFAIDGIALEVVTTSRISGLASELRRAGVVVATDHTPGQGPEAIRNHMLATDLPDGTRLEVEAGYVNWVTIGIAVRREGVLVHESHPGKRIAWPERAAKMVTGSDGGGGIDPTAWKRNRVPIAVDIALGILFFVMAKLTDLSTAAIVGAAVGLALIVVQRFVKVDLIGGLALFGVVMLLISAGLAIAFQDDLAVKLRSTIVGTISAVLFLGDGLFGGRWLGRGMMRYLPFTDIDPGRLAIGMGVLGLVMAGLNTAVAYLASTDAWLFYTTFLDMPLIFLMIFGVFHFARKGAGPAPAAAS
jgi:intracellular septation protein A